MKQEGLRGALKNRTLVILICVIGILAVSYGMYYHDNLIFIIGIGFFIVGYLLIRRSIKECIRDNQ